MNIGKPVLVCVLFFLLPGLAAVSAAAADTQVPIVHIVAKRFEYQPSRVVIPRAQEVELHITSMDVLHGFSIPELNIRVDLEPHKTIIVKLPRLKAGEYHFLCTIFCGSGHGKMHGSLVVK